MVSRRLVLALVCLAASFATAAAFAENHVIQVTNTSFEPSEITIEVGDTVTFQKGATGGAHNVQSDDFDAQCTFGPTCFRCSTGGCQGQGGSGDTSTDPFSVTLTFYTQPGTFGYHCQPHRAFGMTGRIIVEEGDSPPPPPPPPTNGAGTIRSATRSSAAAKAPAPQPSRWSA